MVRTIDEIRSVRAGLEARRTGVRLGRAALDTEEAQVREAMRALSEECPHPEWVPAAMFYSTCAVCGEVDL